MKRLKILPLWGLVLSCLFLTNVHRLHGQVDLGDPIWGSNSGDRAGHTDMSADGSRIVIGAPYFSSSRGCMRVYDWDAANGTWKQVGNDLLGTNPTSMGTGDLYGSVVRISGNGKVVAMGGAGVNNAAGGVRVFTFDSSTSSWVQRGLTIIGANTNYNAFKMDLSYDGSKLIIGAALADGGGSVGSRRGEAKVYEWNGTAWAQLGSTIQGAGNNDFLGFTVAMAGNGQRIAIGSPFNDGSGTDAGSVSVYDWASGSSSWVLAGSAIQGEAAGDESGTAIGISRDGNSLAIGAPKNDGNGTSAGHVRVFAWNSGTSSWSQRGGDLDGEGAGDQFGFALDLAGDSLKLVVGSPSNQQITYPPGWTGGLAGKGQADVFKWNGSTWVQWGVDIESDKLTALGTSVAISHDGKRVAIGQPDVSRTAAITSNGRVLLFAATAARVTRQPAAATSYVGACARFTVGAGPASANIQWQHFVGGKWVNLSNAGMYNGVDNDTLIICSLPYHMSGDSFRVRLAQSGDTIFSNPAVLTLWCPLGFDTHPSNDSVSNGATAMFIGKADLYYPSGWPTGWTFVSASEIKYRWQKWNDTGWLALNNGGNISGADNDTLTVSNVSGSLDSLQLRLYANFLGCEDISTVALLRIDCPLSITQQPVSASSSAGTNVEFVCSASSATASFQWEANRGSGWNTLSNNSLYNGVSNDTLRISNPGAGLNGTQFRVQVSESGCNLSSDEVTLTLKCRNIITGNPVNDTVFVGNNAIFSLQAISATDTIAWQINTGSGWTNATNGGRYSGASDDTLRISAVQLAEDGYAFRVIASEAQCKDTSSGAMLFVRSSCATGTITWDGGGSDESFFTPENWVGDRVPCEGTNIVFDATGNNTKSCKLDSSYTFRNVYLRRGYRARLNVVGTGTVLKADTLVSTAPMVFFSPETGTHEIDVLDVSNNGVVNCSSNKGMRSNTVNIGLAGYIAFRSKSSVYLGHLFVDQYSQFRGPGDGHIYLTGHLSIANRNTFDGNGATLHFTGTGNQNVDVSSANQIKTIPLVVNKASGAVVLQRNLNTDQLTLTSGNINTGSNRLTLTAPGGLFGGSSSSYINGKVGVDHSSAWPGSKMRLPMGKGSKYRPITLHNTSSINTWEVEFMNSDPNGLGSPNAPLSDISADGYWSANRTAGGGGLLADATYFEISDAGKGAWNNGDLRVAHYDGSTGWDDRGGSFTSNAVISSNTSLRGNAVYLLALGNNNAVPAPHVLVAGDVVSGKEIRTTAIPGTSQVAASRMLSFSVFPNPVAETLNISLSGADKGSITLSDLSGKVLGVYSADTRSIDMSQFAAGVYFATFSNGSQRITQRVIRQ